jgi:eukaryotic-like serine/threonine-protein kinase
LKGETLDARTDIFSLGVVIYEMLAGQSPFHGEKTGDVVSAILQTDAPILLKRLHEVPSELERIVGKALHKDRGNRYQSVEQLLIDLRDLRKDSGATRPLRWLVVGVLVALAFAAAAGLFWWLIRSPAKPRLGKLSRLANDGYLRPPRALSSAGPMGA